MWNKNWHFKFSALFKEIIRVYWALLKVMIPAVIVVKILDYFGATEMLAQGLSPIMQLVGLPEEMGIVWAVALLTNVYAAMIVFYNIALHSVFSVAEVTVLGSMILVAHSLPIEGAIAKALGINWLNTLTIRIGGALMLGAILNVFYTTFHWKQEAIKLVWSPNTAVSPSIMQWCVEQLQLFASIFIILASLIVALRILRVLGIEALLHRLLMPLLRGLTLGKDAANITIIGMTLGISFGAGLLIDEVKRGHIDKRDTALVMVFLGLCHSIIEDTILILLLGADITGILWGRLLFAIIITAFWGRYFQTKTRKDEKAHQ